MVLNGVDSEHSGLDVIEFVADAGNDDVDAVSSPAALRLEGGEGDDGCRGGDGDDELDGGTGVDELHAGGGNDTPGLAFGTDTLDGEEGSDVYLGQAAQ